MAEPTRSRQGYLGAIRQEKIDQLAALEDGWDSYGAAPISDKALTVLRVLAAIPTVNGGVQIEWHANGWEVEIEVDADGDVCAFNVEQTGSKASSEGDRG